MRNQIGPPPDPLVKQLLETCVVFSPNPQDPHESYYHWDEYRLMLNLPLALKVIEAWKDQLADYEYVCPVGKSGLTLGVLAARAMRMPMIWIDKLGRVIPQSRDLVGKKVAVIDSHSFMGHHFSLAYSRLVARKAKRIGFFAVIVRDSQTDETSKKLLRLPYGPAYLISASRDIEALSNRLLKCRGAGASGVDAATILNSPDFWGRQD